MHLYVKAEEKCRNLTKFLSIGYLLDAAALFIAAALFACYCMWTGNFDTSTWLLPYNLYIPFDTSTVLGWFLLWLIQCYIALVYSLSATCSMTYFVSCCLYIVAMCDHFNLKVQSINSFLDNLKNSKKLNDAKVFERLKLKLNRIVKLHVTIYE